MFTYIVISHNIPIGKNAYIPVNGIILHKLFNINQLQTVGRTETEGRNEKREEWSGLIYLRNKDNTQEVYEDKAFQTNKE